VATTLNNLGNLHRRQHRMDEARLAYDEALKIRRELAQKNPDTYPPDVATTLNNLGVLDGEQNRTEEARMAFDEALKINRELAQKNPDTYLPDVAMTLNNLGFLDGEQNRIDVKATESTRFMKRRMGIEPTSERNPSPNGPQKIEARMSPKHGFILAFCSLAAPQGQLNQRGFGGSVWESNPPFDPRRAESPALKAGKITGPFSPPLVANHHNKTRIDVPIEMVL